MGQLPDDTLLHDGKRYPLKRHGFARNSEFEWRERHDSSCALTLEDDAETWKMYPFAFRLELRYALSSDTLTIEYRVTNTGSETLPCSVGAHPAFRWPLEGGVPKEDHTLEFSDEERSPIRRLQDGLLQAREFETPIDGRRLQLRESLFAQDALILDRLASRSVRYSAPGAAAIEVSWETFRELGLWSKEGAAFLCIEPWYGFATPVGFASDFERKPGLLHVAPQQSETLTMRIKIS